MRQPAKSRTFPAAILVACLAAGCGSTASSVIRSLPTPTRTAATTAGPAAPATAAPPATVTVTATPKVTARPSPTSPATTAHTASPAPSATRGTGSGTSLLWLWILLGVAAAAGLVAWIAHSARRRSARRSATAADWRSRLVDAYAKGSALHDAISVAEAPGGVAAADAGARWADIQRRADDLTQTLYALREAVADPADQARIADVLASLQAIRSAMDAERALGGASPEQIDVVRSRLLAFEQSLRALRDSDQEHT